MKEKKTGKTSLIVRFLKGHIHLFVIALVFSMLNTAFNALTPQIIRLTTDSVIGTEKWQLPQAVVAALHLDALRENYMTALLLAGALVLGASVLGGICSYISRMNMAKGTESFVKGIRDALYAHIQKLPFAWHVKHQTGEIIQRCTSDVEVVRNFVCNQMVEVFRILFLIVLYSAIMFSMNVKLTLVAILFFPIVIGYTGLFYSKIAKRFLLADEAEGELSSLVQENLTGVRVVRAFGRERHEIARFDEKNHAFANLWIRLGSLSSLYWGLGDLITGLQILTVMCVGVVFAVNGQITLGEFLAFISYNSTLIWPVRSLGRIISDMSKAGVSIDRVAYILDAQEEQEPKEAKRPPMDQDICFEHVNFSYGNGYPILKDLNFRIPAGKTFAILGGTGSGKSTLVHLLDGLYDLPDGAGRITIGGVDLREISREYLRKNIGIVLQEPFLFSRPIGENIAISQVEPEEEQIYAAARIACVDQSIRNFKNGYDTIVGERGVTLSGGQKQRVAIARMLVQQAPIMIFDDSLSAVDAETDTKIRAALQENMEKATVILISHRITTLMQADCILVLGNGRVTQEGTHEELIQQEGTYKDIYEIQMNQEDRSALFAEQGRKEAEA